MSTTPTAPPDVSRGEPLTVWTPTAGTAEAWAHDYLSTTSLAHKLSPPPAPSAWCEPPRPPLRLASPGRPVELVQAVGRIKAPRGGALVHAHKRARLLHGFLHHELQAAELFCWAILAFPEAPRAFKSGLLHIVHDELRHMSMYREHMEALGVRFGELPINDWFWTRVPAAPTPAHFVATLGLGFEGGNLDHAPRFAAQLRAAGDEAAAVLEARIGLEEIPHCSFARLWFERFTGAPLDFDTWRTYLPPPLSPMMMRGDPINAEARLRAGFPPAFVEALTRWAPTPGS